MSGVQYEPAAVPPSGQGYPPPGPPGDAPPFPQEKPAPPVEAVYQQPQPHEGMDPAGPGGNRNVNNVPGGPEGRTWSFGFFDCCADVGTCLFAWFLPCLFYGAVKKRYDHLTTQGTPDPERGSSGYVSGDCCMFCCLLYCGFHWVLEMALRANVRTRYRIAGDTVNDCLAGFFCAPCDLTQQSRELDLEEGSFGNK